MLRRLGLLAGGVALLSGVVSTFLAAMALALGGTVMLPNLVDALARNMLFMPIDMVAIALLSPGRDVLHYPRRVVEWHRRHREDSATHQAERHAERREDEARRNDPAHLAWDGILNPPHAMTDARRSRLENLRIRTETAVDRLGGSLDVGDMDTIVLMRKTLGEVSSAYRATLGVTTTDKSRKAIDRSLDETLGRMVAAAESRLAISDRVVTDRFDTTIRHAQESSDRIARD